MKQSFTLHQTRFLNQDDTNTSSPISMELIDTTYLPAPPGGPCINRDCVIDGNTLIYPVGSCIAFDNFFQSQKVFLAEVNNLNAHTIQQEHRGYRIVGIAGNKLNKCSVAVAVQPIDSQRQLIISKYSINDQDVPTFNVHFQSALKKNHEKQCIQLVDMAYYGLQSIILLVRVWEDEESQQQYKILTLNLKACGNKIINKLSLKNKEIVRFLILQQTMIIFFKQGISLYYTEQFIGAHSSFKKQCIISSESLEDRIIRKNVNVLDYYQVQNQLKFTMYLENTEAVVQCEWLANNSKIYLIQLTKYVGATQEMHRMLKVGKNLLIGHKNSITITHFVVDEDGYRFVDNYTYAEYTNQKCGIRHMQVSQDQMHIIVTVEQEEPRYKSENLILNLSTAQTSKNIFVRLLVCENGCYKSLEGTLSSTSYMLLSNSIKIFNYHNVRPSSTNGSKIQETVGFTCTPHEVIKSMNVHPLGYQFTIIFEGIVRFYNKVSVANIYDNYSTSQSPSHSGGTEGNQYELLEIWSQQYNCHFSKYSQSGTLALCCSEESNAGNNNLRVIIYDCYRFKPIKIIPISCYGPGTAKLMTGKMQWGCSDASITLYIGNTTVNSIKDEKNTDLKQLPEEKYSKSYNGYTNMVMINVFNGQKVRQFRQRDQKLASFKVKNLDYEWQTDRLIASVTLSLKSPPSVCPSSSHANNLLNFKETHQTFLLYASTNKNNDYNYDETQINLSNHRIVFIPQSISYVKICASLNIVFLGSQSGCLYWTAYPLRLHTVDYYSISSPNSSFYAINQEQLHCIPLAQKRICSISLLNNNKYLVVNLSKGGYFTFRVRRCASYTTSTVQSSKMNLIFQELGNPIFNSLTMTTQACYALKKQTLKTLLENRKSCFTDLQEFHKEFQYNHNKTIHTLEKNNKEKELQTVTHFLDELEKVQQQKNKLQEVTKQMEAKHESYKNQKTERTKEKLRELYRKQDQARNFCEQKRKYYEKVYQDCFEEAHQNFSKISEELKYKHETFVSDYNDMMQNLKKFQGRISYEKILQAKEARQEIDIFAQKLKEEQENIQDKINALSQSISSLKKNNERFGNRQCFLEHKKRHFLQQTAMNKQEHEKLIELKGELQQQLLNLEEKTLKKEQLLKNLLNVNTALNKYKQIHEGFSEISEKQCDNLQAEQKKTEGQIKEIMSELIKISQENNNEKQDISNHQKLLLQLKQELKDTNSTILIYQRATNRVMQNIPFSEINSAKQEVKQIKQSQQEAKAAKMREIYEKYYIQDKIQALITDENIDELQKQIAMASQIKGKDKIKNDRAGEKSTPQSQHTDPIVEKTKGQAQPSDEQVQSEKILNELKSHKSYIMNNFKLLDTHNNRMKEEINLNYLRIQSQNYDLISQCNNRKDETSKKKKLLHELIDSVKETQIYLGSMKKDPAAENLQEKQTKVETEIKSIGKINQEKQKEGEIMRYYDTENPKKSRLKTAKTHNSSSKQTSNMKIDRLYSGRVYRNIQSATYKSSKNIKETPFVLFERTKNMKENIDKSTIAQTNSCNNTSMWGSRYQVRKMLDIRKFSNNQPAQKQLQKEEESHFCNSPIKQFNKISSSSSMNNRNKGKIGRRIQTAVNRQRSSNQFLNTAIQEKKEEQWDTQRQMQEENMMKMKEAFNKSKQNGSKPMTANARNRKSINFQPQNVINLNTYLGKGEKHMKSVSKLTNTKPI